MEAYKKALGVVNRLARAGFIAYFAGGWVRDYVMGHPSEDVDIATNASPTEIMELFPNTLLVGLTFGVVIVIYEGHQFEVATFRKDVDYADGRRPTRIENSSPQEDANRRDFTINGMFYDPIENVIHDYVGGREDIIKQIVRTIGDPYERFFEDRLRMLRAFRFSARFSFNIDVETQEAIRENADQLFPAVAMERIWQEFNKMALYPRFDQAIIDMHRLELLEVIFPELRNVHLNELRHLVTSYHFFPENCPTVLYLFQLFPHLNIEKKIEICKRVKATNKDIKLLEYINQFIVEIEKEEQNKKADLVAWSHLYANKEFDVACHFIAASKFLDNREGFLQYHIDRYKKLEKHIDRIKTSKPLINATLLKHEGIPAGKKMGELIKQAEKIAIDFDLNEPDAILDHLKKTDLWKLPV